MKIKIPVKEIYAFHEWTEVEGNFIIAFCSSDYGPQAVITQQDGHLFYQDVKNIRIDPEAIQHLGTSYVHDLSVY